MADAAQRKLKKALANPAGCAKVLADPKKLPTVNVGNRWICQWEQLGLPCPLDAADHFERNAHKICCYCLVIGHSLVSCTVAANNGVALDVLAAGLVPAAANGSGGGKGKTRGGKGKGRDASVSTPAAPLSRWEQMEKERNSRMADDANTDTHGQGRGRGNGKRGGQ